MYFRYNSGIWIPGKVVVIVLILMGLFQTSNSYVGTSDSTIFYFGDNWYGQNGQENASKTDLFLDVDVSLLRSTSCGSKTTVLLFDDNTMISYGQRPIQWEFEASYPEISSVSSDSGSILYTLASNASIYGYGNNPGTAILNDSVLDITVPTLSPPRLNEDIRFCATFTCLAFDHFPPGSITDEPVIHEPNIPLYKFIGAWGDLSYGHLGMYPLPLTSSSGTFYVGPDLIVKKASVSRRSSIFILHNNTVLVSGNGDFTPPTNGLKYLYHPILYNSSVGNASEIKIVDASNSPYHALLLSEDHRVFFFGDLYAFVSGIPGFGDNGTIDRVTEVPFDGILYPDDYIVQVSTQDLRSSVITQMGYVYIWGTQYDDGYIKRGIQYIPTLENTFLHDRYAVKYLDQAFITSDQMAAYGSCIVTRPRPGNCTGVPPSAEYYCIGGLWTTRGGWDLETLNISSPTAIDANLTISGPLIINPQSNISVTQCLSVGSIVITKQQGDDSPSPDIISTYKHCPDISGTTVSVIPTGNVTKCEKMTATLSKNETGGRIVYSANFTINDDDCQKNCTGELPPAYFVCTGGVWTTRGGSTIGGLNITSPVEIDGNVTITGPLVINPQSNISVTGCLSVGSIEIVKQQGDDSPSAGIISTDSHCPDLSGTTVSVISTGNGTNCEKMTATLWKVEIGGRFVYSANFTINRNDCKNCTGELPAADFVCIGGVWTPRGGGANIGGLTITSPIEIDGNLTLSGPLVINPQSSISVSGCLSVGSIEITKQQGDDSPSQDIILTGKHCPDISATAVSVAPTGKVKKCQKMTAKLSKGETGARSSYSAIFNINNNDCNRWWIILVSVLGGVVLIVIIAILVALRLRRRRRRAIKTIQF